ncbi:MAG: YraN family protein [Acidobacteria bacterium]|nr:YraN family protein [Acidobacteriota bacterium]
MNQPAKDQRHALGQQGEQLALHYLLEHGYRLVVTNYVAPIGYGPTGRPITGEIDIIAYDESSEEPGRPFTLTFIEVKTRTDDFFTSPESAVDRAKQRHIIKTARLYRRILSVNDEPFRYDVISIVLRANQAPQIELLRGYFSEETFARSRWMAREDEFGL